MDEKISKLFLPLLDKLYNTEPAGEPFREPVDVEKYSCKGYYDHIKHPIDLSTIRRRLLNHEYKDAWRFVADIQLMFSNAYLYNKKGTPVYEFTNKLSKMWTSDLTPIMQRLNYCCGTLHKFGPQLLYCHGTTPDRYCQIPISGRYKCYQDQYSFCLPCFNKIETDYINIQGLSCEMTRMKLPTQPVKKSDFVDCTNDHWQYETFVQCTQCSRRVHQICETYPADEEEIENCIQHADLEIEQKMLCQIPEKYRKDIDTSKDSYTSKETDSSKDTITSKDRSFEDSDSDVKIVDIKLAGASEFISIDDELMEFARNVDESSHMTNSAPTSPNPSENHSRFDCAKEESGRRFTNSINNNGDHLSCTNFRGSTSSHTSHNTKNSVDNIAARLSINKLTSEAHTEEIHRQINSRPAKHDKFVCNHCYRKKKIGFDLRHRKYSARRLPHTRMSKYIETKVNEHIRENSPTAGDVTIRVLTSYTDTIKVKPKMSEYVKNCRQKTEYPSQAHQNLENYPEEFSYTNRAIFAWQEIDGVDVCVFGMHVQEYGEDCPEPNRQIVYLSYLDSVHFFRPKQVRTAVYHEILLSYFKYVKKLGFRKVFIWVCPSRKGDDYIFYRHPTEQKMPTLKRLSDWYVNLLDKGVMAGIVEKHHNIFQYAEAQNWTSLLSIPYLSGDYWPGEFERLLDVLGQSQKDFQTKSSRERRDSAVRPAYTSELEPNDFNRVNGNYFNGALYELPSDRHHMPPVNGLYHQQLPNPYNGKIYHPHITSSGISASPRSNCYTPDGDISIVSIPEDRSYGGLTPESSRSGDFDQACPLDLTKSSSNTSPDSYFDDDGMSEVSYQMTNNRKRRRRSVSSGYTKKRGRGYSQISNSRGRLSQGYLDTYSSQSKTTRSKTCTQSYKDQMVVEDLLNPEEELIRNLHRSLKRQKDGFIVARLTDCDYCGPSFEIQRRREELTIECNLMEGREPFLQLARLKNYEFSTLRRAKFSSLAMVKHLGQFFELEPICNECYSFDSSKRHYACSQCEDFYLCTSCHENTHHGHFMSLIESPITPDIDDFLQQCSLASNNSISSASSTISNKSFNENPIELSTQSVVMKTTKTPSLTSTPLNRHLSNTSLAMPLSCQKQKNRDFSMDSKLRTEDEENANVRSFGSNTKLSLANQPAPSHSSSNARNTNDFHYELDQVLVDNFIRQAEVSHDIDFEQLKTESKKLLTHYCDCPMKESCNKCKFVVLSCSVMSVLMKNTRMPALANCNSSEIMPNNNSNNNHLSGINLTTAHRFSYPKDK